MIVSIAEQFSPVETGVARVETLAKWREQLAAMGLVVAADFGIYRSEGFAGPAILFAIAPVLIVVGLRRLKGSRSALLFIGLLTFAVAARQLWCGNNLATACGIYLLAAFSLQGIAIAPMPLVTIGYLAQLAPVGLKRLWRSRSITPSAEPKNHFERLARSTLTPMFLLIVFSALFILANPDLARMVEKRWWWMIEQMINGLLDIAWMEVVFCLAMLILSFGLLNPAMMRVFQGKGGQPTPVVDAEKPSANYEMVRNTLFVVIVLFIFYLAFEFLTLWFREFPNGFYYSGYAHEGAAWLTVALALATAILSVFFRGEILLDPRLPYLRRLAWIWAILNGLLAIAVYHRLWIYINFNGMTRMRTIGLLGMTAVVAGFGLVLVKIVGSQSFAWLLRRQLLAVAAMAYVYAVAPVDRWITAHNVREILNGRLAPSVQIAEHPNSAEGFLMLEPLLSCPDPIIREGIRARLAMMNPNMKWSLPTPAPRQEYNPTNIDERPLSTAPTLELGSSWSSHQIAASRLQERLTQIDKELEPYSNDPIRAVAAWKRFREYAYRWY